MLNKAFILSLLLSYSLLGLCQAIDSNKLNTKNSTIKKGYFGLNYGFAMPMGSFSTNDQSPDNSAFAVNGQNLHLFDLGYLLNESFSIKSFFINATNKIDENLLGKSINKNSTKNYVVETSSYELKAFMLGLGVTKSNPLIDFDLHFLLGYGSSFIPSINLVESDPLTLVISETLFRPSKENGFGVGLSSGFRIHLNEFFDMTAQLSYIIFEKEFEQIKIENNSTSISQSKIGYEILTINFGLAYRFNIENNK